MPPTDFDLVIFDCDGVLIDSEALSCACLSELLSRHGYPIDVDGVFEQFLGRSFAVVEEQYRLKTGRPIAPGFADEYRRVLKERYKRDLHPMPGIEDVLKHLRTRFCVASSSDSDRLAFSLAVAGLSRYFEGHVYSSDQVAHGKPAPDLFLHAAEAMRSAPARTLVVEDSVNGVRAGKAARMTVWGFVGGSHHADRDGAAILTEAGADRVIRDFTDFALI